MSNQCDTSAMMTPSGHLDQGGGGHTLHHTLLDIHKICRRKLHTATYDGYRTSTVAVDPVRTYTTMLAMLTTAASARHASEADTEGISRLGSG